MKIRIMGTLDELSEAAARLGEVFELLEVSDPYQNRGTSKLYRLYVEAAIPAPVQATAQRVRRRREIGRG